MQYTIDKYTYIIKWDSDVEMFKASAEEVLHIHCHGDTQYQALARLRRTLKELEDHCYDEGETLPEPFGG
jgi:predicted RNase H-like HicB family nuclease